MGKIAVITKNKSHSLAAKTISSFKKHHAAAKQHLYRLKKYLHPPQKDLSPCKILKKLS
jgi:hypothetical protein